MDQLTDEERAQRRSILFEQNFDDLVRLAGRSVERGMTPDDFMMVCINVDDPAWTNLANHLMPKEDWQQYRDMGLTPVARGSVQRSGMVEMLSSMVPGIADAFSVRPKPSMVHVAVLDAGGASVFYFEV